MRVGEPVANVARAYPRATIDKSKDGVTALRRYHPTFANIYYYFDEDDAKKTITHIRFDVLEESNPGEFLRRKLRDTLGPPRLGAKTEHYAWIRDGMPGVFQAEPYSYLVMVDGHAPRWWKPKP